MTVPSLTEGFFITYNNEIIKYSGTDFSVESNYGYMTVSFTGYSFVDVSAVNVNSIYALDATGKILHFDGTDWSAFSDFKTALNIGSFNATSIFAAVDNSIYIGGEFDSVGQVVKYNGSSWSYYNHETNWNSHKISAINGLQQNTPYFTTDNFLRGGEIFLGNALSADYSTAENFFSYGLSAVWVAPDSIVFAGGYNGLILVKNETWSEATDNLYGNEGLRAGVTTSQGKTYIVGEAGLIMEKTTGDWTFSNSGTDQLNSIEGLDNSEIFAVGSSAKVIKYNGTNWSPVDVSICAGTYDLYAIKKLSASYFIGGYKSFFRVESNGSCSQVTITSTGNPIVYDVNGTNENDFKLRDDRCWRNSS